MRKRSLQEQNEGHRRAKLHLGLPKLCPTKRCSCFKAHFSSQEIPFFLCLPQHPLLCGRNRYAHMDPSPWRALGKEPLCSPGETSRPPALPSPRPQQCLRLVNPALHSTQPAYVVNKDLYPQRNILKVQTNKGHFSPSEISTR